MLLYLLVVTLMICAQVYCVQGVRLNPGGSWPVSKRQEQYKRIPFGGFGANVYHTDDYVTSGSRSGGGRFLPGRLGPWVVSKREHEIEDVQSSSLGTRVVGSGRTGSGGAKSGYGGAISKRGQENDKMDNNRRFVLKTEEMDAEKRLSAHSGAVGKGVYRPDDYGTGDYWSGSGPGRLFPGGLGPWVVSKR